MTSKITGIYKIENKINNKKYIDIEKDSAIIHSKIQEMHRYEWNCHKKEDVQDWLIENLATLYD